MNETELWDYTYNQLIRYINTYNRLPVYKKGGPHGTNDLAKWCAKQRDGYRSGELSEGRAAVLEELDGWIWCRKESIDEAWMTACNNLVSYIAEHGSLPVKGNRIGGRDLAVWFYTQRRLHKTGKLQANKIGIVDGIEMMLRRSDDETYRRSMAAILLRANRVHK